MELADIREGEINVKVLRSGRKAIVIKRGDDIKVFDEQCPHMGGDMSEATYCDSAGTLACGWHGYEFGVDDGCVRENPNERMMKVLRAPSEHYDPEKTPRYRLRVLPFEVRGSTLYFGPEDDS
jgi:nitrite reductase/ring-hydroxylating ferredoxin subunit